MPATAWTAMVLRMPAAVKPRTLVTHPAGLRVPPAVARFAAAVCVRAGLRGPEVEHISQALQVVPRDQFLDQRHKARALEDSALSSGFGRPAPAPYMTARMLALVGVRPGVTVLELECGAGYASALMCVLGARVFAAERNGLQAQATRRHLDALGLNRVLVATGHLAWADSAPFDAIVSHAAIKSEEDLAAFVALLNPKYGRLVAVTEHANPGGARSEKTATSAPLLLLEMVRGEPHRTLI